MQSYIKMGGLQHQIRLLSRLGTRNIGHSSSVQIQKEPEPVKLAFASYEDTKTRDVNEVFENPPLMICHGLFGSKGNWNSICKVLHRRTTPTKKIIAIDARNHGDSPHSKEHSYEALAADIQALLAAERIPKVACLGHSMGGRTAMYLALQYPQLVERLIVVDISPISNSRDLLRMIKYFSAMATIQVPPNLALSMARAAVDAALIPTVPEKGIRAFLLTNLIQNPNGSVTWRLNLRALRDNYSKIAKFPIEPESGKQYLGPALFIAGEKSDYLKNTDHSGIKRFFPNAKFATIPGAGHWLHSEKPAEFIQIVLNFLEQKK